MASPPLSCMICQDECDDSSNKTLPWEETNNLESQLSVILLVRKILKVPKHAVETVLRTEGDPSTWGLKMCGPCRRIFTEAEFLNSRINQLNKEFSDLSNLLRRQVKKDWFAEETNATPNHQEEKVGRNKPDKIVSQRQGRRRPGRRGFRPTKAKITTEATSKIDDVRSILFGSKGMDKSYDLKSASSVKTKMAESRPQRVLKKEFLEINKVVKLEREDNHENNDSIPIEGEESSVPSSFGIEDDDNDDDDDGDNSDFFDDSRDSDYFVDEEEVTDTSSKPKRSSHPPKQVKDEQRIDVFSVPQPLKNNGIYLCPICPKKMLSKITTHGHILRAHFNDKNPFHCHLCEKSYTREITLRTHLKDHHAGARTPLDEPDEVEGDLEEGGGGSNARSRKYKCDLCPKRKVVVFYKSLETLEAHKKKIHYGIKKPYECKICRRSFSFPQTLAQHFFVHKRMEREKKAIRQYFCHQCNKQFRDFLALRRHFKSRKHSSKCPFPCSICGEGFMTEKVLETHKIEKHRVSVGNAVNSTSKEEKPFCAPCNREFANVVSLKAHFQTKAHTSDSKYWCELCSKGFMQKPSLVSHQALEHYKELKIDPFKCNYCSKILASKRALDHHVRVKHTKDTKYRCEECDLGFMFLKAYNHHLAVVHTKEKSYLCTECPKSFSLRHNLMVHMRVHSGEKPFKCKHCAREYADRPTFKRHLETHGEQVHVCAICHKQFKVWHSYRLHMRATHNQTIYKATPAKVRRSIEQAPEESTSNKGVEEGEVVKNNIDLSDFVGMGVSDDSSMSTSNPT